MIVFPRPIPSVGAMAQAFELERVDYLSPEGGGRIGGVSAGQPLWKMAVSLNNLKERDADLWRAWVLAQRGPQRHFLGFDIDRRMPIRHRDGRPFTKRAASWSESLNDDNLALLTLNGLLPGTILSIGDYVGFRWDAAGAPAGTFRRRALVRVIAGGVGGAEGSITVAVEPSVPPVVPPNAEAHLDMPACLMRLTEAKLGEQVIGYTAAGSRISAIQDLLP
jgi:hypothetical protein